MYFLVEYYSLFRSQNLEITETRFLIFKDKVPILVQLCREVNKHFLFYYNLLLNYCRPRNMTFRLFTKNPTFSTLLISNDNRFGFQSVENPNSWIFPFIFFCKKSSFWCTLKIFENVNFLWINFSRFNL